MLTGIRNVDRKILNKLDDVDLVKACQVNKQANDICNEQVFWMNRVFNKFGYVGEDVLRKYKGDRSWSDYYIYDLRKINKNFIKNLIIFNYLRNYDNLTDKVRSDHILIAINKDLLPDDDLFLLTVLGGNKDLVEYFVNKRKYSNYPNFSYMIDLAAERGYKDVVEYLFNKAASQKNIIYHPGYIHGMMISAKAGHKDIVEFFVNKAESDDDDPGYREGMISAVESGHKDIVEYFTDKLETEESPDYRKDVYRESMEIARNKGNKDLVDFFSEKLK